MIGISDMEVKSEADEAFFQGIPTKVVIEDDVELREAQQEKYLKRRINNKNFMRRILYSIGRQKLYLLGFHGNDAMTYDEIDHSVDLTGTQVRKAGARAIGFTLLGTAGIALGLPHLHINSPIKLGPQPEKTCEFGPRTDDYVAKSSDIGWSVMIPKISGVMDSGICYDQALDMLRHDYGTGPKYGNHYKLPTTAHEVIVTHSAPPNVTVTTPLPTLQS